MPLREKRSNFLEVFLILLLEIARALKSEKFHLIHSLEILKKRIKRFFIPKRIKVTIKGWEKHRKNKH